MNLPPYVIDLRIISREQRRIRLWLPLFLLWPLFLVLAVLALVLTILADVFLWAAGRTYHRYTFFLLHTLALFADVRGTSIDVRSEDALVHVVLK